MIYYKLTWYWFSKCKRIIAQVLILINNKNYKIIVCYNVLMWKKEEREERKHFIYLLLNVSL